jgi:5-methyltetrahydrofolate--homocysteine methyltransferase
LWDHCHTALGRAAFSLGLNCGDGASKLADVVSHLAHTARTFVSCHPSAGLPDRAGRYPASPSEFADSLADLARAGWLNIVGGCCGTTPDHIRALAAAVEGVPPRRLPGRLPRPGR